MSDTTSSAKRVYLLTAVVLALTACASPWEIRPVPGSYAGEAVSTETTVTLKTEAFYDYLLPADQDDDPANDYLAPYHVIAGAPPVSDVEWDAVVLENEFISVTVVPDLGGRILRFINKTTGSNQFYENPEGIKINPWGRHGWWIATGGHEVMAPWDEHGGMFYLPFDDLTDAPATRTYDLAREDDGVRLTIGFDEGRALGIERWYVEQSVFVPNDFAWFSVETRATNKSEETLPLQLWTNAMISPGPGNMETRPGRYELVDHQVVFDGRVTQLYNHNDNLGERFWGDPWDVIDWPRHQGILGSTLQTLDLSLIRNWHIYDLKFAGLFTVAEEPSSFVGQYNLQADEGIVRVFPEQITRGINTGVKYWHWGSFSEQASWQFADGRSTYAELMVGPARVFQEPAQGAPSFQPTGEEYAVDVEPGESIGWTEHYLSPHGTGTVVHAGVNGAVNVRPDFRAATEAEIPVEIAVYATTEYEQASIVLYATEDGNRRAVYQETVDIGPGTDPGPYRTGVMVERTDAEQTPVFRLEVRSKEGDLILESRT